MSCCEVVLTGHRMEHCTAPECPLVRFWTKVTRTPGGCWWWTGAKIRHSGYGRIYSGGDPAEPTVMYAHRFAYKHLIGPIPQGLVLDHLCRNASCVNPLHLQPVTNRENVVRGSARAAKVGLRTCPWGHSYTPENTYLSSSGGRACRTCRRVGTRVERVR